MPVSLRVLLALRLRLLLPLMISLLLRRCLACFACSDSGNAESGAGHAVSGAGHAVSGAVAIAFYPALPLRASPRHDACIAQDVPPLLCAEAVTLLPGMVQMTQVQLLTVALLTWQKSSHEG